MIQGRAALTINGYYGAHNPSCATQPVTPCPVQDVTYTNITQAAGTTVAYLIDFEGLPTNTIEGVAIDRVALQLKDGGDGIKNCSRVTGTFRSCPACSHCAGLRPL